MYLNAYQKQVVSLVDEYGPLQKRQLEFMVNAGLERKLPNLDGYVNQLCQFGGFQKMEHDGEMYVGYRGDVPDPAVVSAFEVMMQFVPNVIVHGRGRRPAVICFLVRAKEKVKEVRVIPVLPGNESAVSGFIKDSAGEEKSEMVIFLLTHKEQITKMKPADNHRYALVSGSKVSFFEK